MEKYRFTDIEHSLLENARVPFAIYQFIDKRVVTVVLSQGFCELFGYDDIAKAYYDMDNNMYKDTHPDDAARIAEAAFRFATEGGKYDVVYRTRNAKCGNYSIVHAQGEHIYTDTGVRLAQVWYTNEGAYSSETDSPHFLIANQLETALFEKSFVRANYFDHLTGLPSMSHFFELATIKKAEIKSKGRNPVILFMDFSGMKYFNHKYGFAEGDRLLQAFARIIAEYFGNENCSRIGQDHFTVIFDDENLEETLNRLFQECKLLNNGDSLPLHIGIYNNWSDEVVVSMACDRAKFACDTLKNVYSSSFSYYDLSMKNTEDKRQYIIANIDKAIAEKWIKVYYQPIVRTVNGRVCDEEALARWIDPVKGFMSPGDFIPILEEYKLIYKLDLFVVDCVLVKMKELAEAGLEVIPQSINLSRSDFDSCDIVEEIRRRVDDVGISHDMLTVEITESIIGKDFEFMKEQINRFREQGFAVWMDDFGSGYSSLDVLQSVQFDLIKFDMRFIQQIDESEKGKIILTNLLDMVTSLNIDTLCEGVETEEHVKFLREAGCSKLQGYHFCKPIPVEQIFERYSTGKQIGFENPAESKYYEIISRVSLHDLSIIQNRGVGNLENFFNTIPMAVLEMHLNEMRFTRTNQAYRDFFMKHLNINITDKLTIDTSRMKHSDSPFVKILNQSRQDGDTLFINGTLSDNTNIHCCFQRIAVNHVNNTIATAVAILSVSSNHGTTYANIASALAADYENLFYVDLLTDSFIEYSPEINNEDLVTERHGEDFFNQSLKDANNVIYHKDLSEFKKAFTKENVTETIKRQGMFSLTYRTVYGDKAVYVSMKAVHMPQDPRHLIIGVSNIDLQVRQKMEIEKIKRNEMISARIMALSGDYICMYTVDPETEDYFEYTAADSYKVFGFAKSGSNFFNQAHINCTSAMPPDEQEKFISSFTKENVIDIIREKNIFDFTYHLIISDNLVAAHLKAVIMNENDKETLIICVQKI